MTDCISKTLDFLKQFWEVYKLRLDEVLCMDGVLFFFIDASALWPQFISSYLFLTHASQPESEHTIKRSNENDPCHFAHILNNR